VIAAIIYISIYVKIDIPLNRPNPDEKKSQPCPIGKTL
jgi:hypothetical protein